MSSRLSALVGKSDSAEAPAPAIDPATFVAVIRHILDIQKSQEEALVALADVVAQPIKFGTTPIESINMNSPGLSPASKQFAVAVNTRTLARKRIADLLDGLTE